MIDTNCLISGLLRDSASRRIILHERFRFYAPERLLVEIIKYHGQIVTRSGLEERLYSSILHTLLERIELVPHERYMSHFARAFDVMVTIDEFDTSFLALGLALHLDGIWTDDKHFQEQRLLKVYGTEELLRIIEMGMSEKAP